MSTWLMVFVVVFSGCCLFIACLVGFAAFVAWDASWVGSEILRVGLVVSLFTALIETVIIIVGRK